MPITKGILHNAAAKNRRSLPSRWRASRTGGTSRSNDEEMQKATHRKPHTAQPATMRRSTFPGVALLAGLAVAVTSALSGCSSLYSEGATAGAGIAGAAIAAKVTNNAAVATGIGLGAVAAARAGVQYSERVIHRNTQDSIAIAAGPLAVGAVAPWSITHSVPLEEDEHGRVTVSRTISAGELDCKEIVFSVDKTATNNVPASSAFYVASICRDGSAWKWASAEPATERWGSLQ
ncbi:hypothetical protein J8I87_18200 [Paraburkholderia sp. LEh10]|jgi:hypothetical protein|nr:hypothetical protein [Paraburkholderia sp. LEh10]